MQTRHLHSILGVIIGIALSIMCATTSHAQQSSSDPFQEPEETCAICKEGTEIIDRLHKGCFLEEDVDYAIAYIEHCDVYHCVNLLYSASKSIQDYSSQKIEFNQEQAVSFLKQAIETIIDRHEIFTSMANGRENNFSSNLNNLTSWGILVLPAMSDELCAMIHQYEDNKAYGINNDGYFYNGLRSYLEFFAYGDNSYMRQFVPNFEESAEHIIKEWNKYSKKTKNITVIDKTLRSILIESQAHFSYYICYHGIYPYLSITALSSTEPHFADFYLNNAKDILRVVYYSLPYVAYNEVLSNIGAIFSANGKGDELIKITYELNIEIYGNLGSIVNQVNSATKLDLGTIKSNYMDYVESLIAKGYEFAYYAPLKYPKEIAEEDQAAYKEYRVTTCKFLGDVFGTERLLSNSNLRQYYLMFESIKDFLYLEEDTHLLLYNVYSIINTI